ncbi:uncharacterized protein LOC105702210 [Orussus abietinus]|uniref:uncharacterized protein LOC105702210 n=1 Tax=Orussus abietinus TaxID=222816 RepID=UPI000625C806|nr:uncharacterized protein LOC105702210 [Orussus abietinus]XP_012285015.1 uncharacterized protein LOC105702210 [Orussus abietinus]
MKRNKVILILCIMASTCRGISSPWRPVVPSQFTSGLLHQEAAVYSDAPLSPYGLEDSLPRSHSLSLHDRDQCALYKVSMRQQLYFEYIHYKTDLPDLKEFTLCMWTKFHNHSNDHPLFSYAVGDQSRGILSWVANTPRSSYYMMNVDGHNLYRLNYPLRLNKWYHSCQSWNGRTGEWQIWVNDERVGRGFNNRLVGHVIKGGGVAISGQEQRQLGGGFLEGEEAPEASGGYLGELTMLQLYGVALTAGKAHKDHKHHHAHHYEHDTSNNTPRPTTKPPVTGPPLPMHPFLTGGQINHQVKINLGAPLQVTQNGVTLRHPALPPQAPSLQTYPPANPSSLSSQPTASTSFAGVPSYPGTYSTSEYFGNRVPDFQNLQGTSSGVGNGFSFISGEYHDLFKRDKDVVKRDTPEVAKTSEAKIAKRETKSVDKVSFVPAEEGTFGDKVVSKRDSEKKKRGLFHLSDGSIIDDSFLAPQGLDEDYFSGLASFGLQPSNKINQIPPQSAKEDEREPAEGEVKLVMNICDGCAEEPFEKALVMGWRSVPKKLYSGALYLQAAQACKRF